MRGSDVPVIIRSTLGDGEGRADPEFRRSQLEIAGDAQVASHDLPPLRAMSASRSSSAPSASSFFAQNRS